MSDVVSEARRPSFLAEFATPEAIVAAARAARERGFRVLDAFTPFSVPELDEPLAASTEKVKLAALIGGLAGGVGGFLLQVYSAVYDYPIDVGGRPAFSWPAFVPLAFELMVLGAALTGFVAFLVTSGLPRYHHPVFEIPDFERATRDRFYLWIAERSNSGDARSFLESLSPLDVREVAA